MCIGPKSKQGVEDFIFIIVGQKIGMSFLEFWVLFAPGFMK
jgi:hypothetical protein